MESDLGCGRSFVSIENFRCGELTELCELSYDRIHRTLGISPMSETDQRIALEASFPCLIVIDFLEKEFSLQ